jgi:N-methylhydantoinase B
MEILADADTGTIDPVTLEIISHRLHEITKEVAATLERVGGTVNTTQLHDYISALYRANGDVLCAGRSSLWHVACAGFAVKRIIERFQDDDGIYPGDMFLLNDPYVAAIHQSDVYIVSPIHYQDRLVAWSATFVHVTDIGALSPGGNSPGATEISHEGVRIPGIKLIERGKVRRDVFDAICNMTRQPALVGLDLKCEIAANNVARARIEEVYAQYGPDVVDAVSADMIRYTEQILRKRLLEIPDGSWRAAGTIETPDTQNIVVTLTKNGDHLLFDFAGTDRQVKVGINLPYHATYGACFGAVVGLLAWDIPKNHGAFAPIEVAAPPGTLVHVQPPGPVSMSTTSGGTVVKFLADAVMAQMVAGSERWRTEVMAKGLGHWRVRVAGTNQHGWYYVATFGGLDGSGARARGDGIDCGGGGLTSDHNVEWYESNYPFLYLFRRQITDGGGAGKSRGGTGQEVAATIHDAPEGLMRCVAYGVSGLRNSGRGMFGGYSGAPSTLFLAKGTRVLDLFAQNVSPVDLALVGGDVRALPYCEFELRAGDVLINGNSSGGGYGDPLERDPAAVANDVSEGLVSQEAALDLYGVVLDGAEVNRTATQMARARLRQERRDAGDRATAVGPDVDGNLWSGTDVTRQTEIALHPLRENLEVARHAGSRWIRCAKCKHLICREDEDWAAACNRTLLPPTKAGPLMQPLEGHFVLKQLHCPSCAVLFEAEFMEAPPDPVISPPDDV